MAGNLAVLGFFKYFNFFVDTARPLLEALGPASNAFVLDVVLPVGISFYTFQTLSYTIDIYRGELKPTADLLDFALFVSFFPQLVSGPIERARRLLPQITRPRAFDRQRFEEGCWLIYWGLYKKVWLFRVFSGWPTGSRLLHPADPTSPAVTSEPKRRPRNPQIPYTPVRSWATRKGNKTLINRELSL